MGYFCYCNKRHSAASRYLLFCASHCVWYMHCPALKLWDWLRVMQMKTLHTSVVRTMAYFSRFSARRVYRRIWRQIRYFGFATEKQLDSLWSKFQIQTLRACAVEALSAQKKELLRQHVNILNLTTKAGHSSPKQIPDPDLVRMKLYTRRRKTTMHTHYVINPGTSRKVVRYFH